MAIKVAGLKTAKTSSELKIENQSSLELPKNALEDIRKILAYLPIEHQRGLEKVKLVDFIKHPQMKTDTPIKGDLPGLYHPKAGNQNAYLEVSTGALVTADRRFCQTLDGEIGI